MNWMLVMVINESLDLYPKTDQLQKFPCKGQWETHQSTILNKLIIDLIEKEEHWYLIYHWKALVKIKTKYRVTLLFLNERTWCRMFFCCIWYLRTIRLSNLPGKLYLKFLTGFCCSLVVVMGFLELLLAWRYLSTLLDSSMDPSWSCWTICLFDIFSHTTRWQVN